jgi:ArsR family transcriptional regulator, arsenate/arsenite/antimonite-responsive transcriptional repressor
MKPHDHFKALADPTRLRIVVLLSRGELCVCDLTEVLRLPQSTISRHMSKLKSAGLVTDRRAGKWVHYSVTTETFPAGIASAVGEHLADIEPFQSDLSHLDKYQAKKKCD